MNFHFDTSKINFLANWKSFLSTIKRLFQPLERTFHQLERVFHRLECTFHRLEHKLHHRENTFIALSYKKLSTIIPKCYNIGDKIGFYDTECHAINKDSGKPKCISFPLSRMNFHLYPKKFNSSVPTISAIGFAVENLSPY